MPTKTHSFFSTLIVFLCAGLISCAISRTAIASPSTAYINADIINTYMEPRADAPLATQAIYNTPVQILQSAHNFALIQTPDNYQSWIDKRYLATHSHYKDASVAKVTNIFANIYKDPNTDTHPPLFTVPFSTELTILKADDERWISVQLADGSKGWIQRGDIAIDPKPLSMSAMLEFSHKFIGLPYLWAGASTYGFDCSGFVQTLYRMTGVNFPRDAIYQSYWPGLIQVPFKNARPGDLLYFGWNDVISHAAVYLGDNKFINSTAFANPSVQISDIRLPHWKDIFIVALHPDTSPQPEFQSGIYKIPDDLLHEMRQYTWRPGCPVPLEDLVYVKLTYWGFDNAAHEGALIVNRAVAEDVQSIFKELYAARFPIEKMQPIENYQGNDLASMAANNSSAFNCRPATDFREQFSIHSYGLAIDINPLINPYVNDGKASPEQGATNVDRKTYHKGKIIVDSFIYQTFAKYGWTWGGSWPGKIQDYQHFEKQPTR